MKGVIKIGGRGASSGINSNFKRSLSSIRNLKKEKMIVLDNKGNIVYIENGTKTHAGYNEYDYANKIVAHNHPKGTFYIPSKKDLETFYESNMKEMIVASKDYIVSVKRNANKRQVPLTNIANNENIRNASSKATATILKKYPNETRKYNSSFRVTNAKSYNKIISSYTNEMFKSYQKELKKNGYIMSRIKW